MQNIGLLIRAFASKSELVSVTVEKVAKVVDKALTLKSGEDYAIADVTILVPMDRRFKDCDCGGTADILRQRYPEEKYFDVFIKEEFGDIFCGVLNQGVISNLMERNEYSMVLSTEAESYLNAETIDMAMDALKNGAKVAGIVISELADSINDGRIANTFAIWDNIALTTVGGFNLSARQAMIGEDRPNAGVEEIIPLVELVRLYGPCIAPIQPQGEGVKQWVAPTDPYVLTRHEKKMESKLRRQVAHAESVGSNLEFIKSGVMSGYGWKRR